MTEKAVTASTLPLGLAVLPLVTMLALFALGLAFLDMDGELLVLVMLGAAAVAAAIAVRHGRSWSEVLESTGQKFAAVLPAIMILLSIGMLIGTWMVSGTIPFLVYWGVRLVSPEHLVLTAFLATATMSLCTGTSWGSAGTIGVALMGTAVALGAPLAPTAGAVVSGAYFGDKLSPLSDTTNIAAISARADLYRHIRHMLYTAIPSTIAAVIVYGLFARTGLGDHGPIADGSRAILLDIESTFSGHVIVLLPLLLVIVAIVRKVPPVIAMAASSFVAVLLGIALQGFSVQDSLLAAVRGFDTAMVQSVGVEPAAVSEAFRTLVARGGLYSMADTLILIIAAFLLAGGLDVSGALQTLIHAMLGAARGTLGLIGATMTSGATMVALTSHAGVTALVVGELFQDAYEERGLAPENLSRSIEDSVTIVEPLLPWTVSAVFMAGTLGVATLSYLPWAVFCYGGPLFSLLYAATYARLGIGIRQTSAAVA